ncbi:MAG: Ig-like domain-containing protein, partial [Chloroflexota bacterium]
MDKYILLGLIATIFAIGSLTNSAEATLPSQSSDLSEWEFRNGGSYVSGNSGTIQNPGSGTDYSVTYWRTNPAVIDHGKQVTFDFYVDQIDSKSYFSLIANQPEFERISILETNGKLLVHIKIGDSAAQKITLLSSSDFQANRWYSAAFTVDDTNGFSVEVEDRDNPTVNGFYQLPNNQMSAGATWYFQGWTYQHTTYLDNFSVVDGTSGSPTSTPTSAVPSEWEFRNGGSYVSGNSGTIQNPGSGTDYSVTFWRASPTVIDSGKQVKFDFYVDQTNSKTYLSLLANQTEYERISILETNGKLLVHIKIGDNAAQKFTLLSGGDFQANRWYSAAITVDDTNGFLVEVEDRDNPTISGSYRLQNGLTSAEATWYFQGWTYQHTTFLENYSVDAAPANPTPTPATPSDWEFRNGGSYVSGDFGVIQNPGSGIDYSVTFWRANPATIDDGMQVSFDFYVDQTNSKTYLSLLANQTEYERISILETNGKLLAHVKVGDSAAQKFTLLPAGDFQASRWYSAAITVDDTNGFLVEVADRDDPTVNGSYQTQSDLMSAGITWYFQGWTYQHTAFLDNYAVETNQIDPTATPTATPTFTPTPLPSSTPTVTSTPSPTATPEEPSCGLLEQEAETATVFGRMTIGNDSRASEGQFIHIPDGAGDNYNFSGTSPDRAEFCFEITEAGNYSISAVVSSEGGSALSDSFYVQVNNQPFGGYLWDVTLSDDFVPDHVSDRGGDNKIIVPLDEGENTVSVHLREDGTKLDRIALERESDEPTPEAMPVVASFNSSNGAPLGQGSVIMHQGYLFMPSGKDSGRPGGGFSFYDISDPANPFTVTEKFDSITFPMREPHTIGVQDDTFALQTTEGVMFWDMSDVSNPALITHMDLPEIQEADYGGSWWLHWQAPYLYVATLNNGLYIVNAADPANPVLANRLLPGDLGMAPRGVFLLGNIMVTTQNNRVKTFDVSDPVNPVALDFVNTASAYSWLLHGDLVLGAGDGQQLIVVSIADPTNLVELSSDAVLGGPGAYLTVQDNFAHVGASDHYIKIDIADPANPVAVGQGSSGLSGRDEDFATALGNLVFVGNDHENGSVLLQHDPNPDTTGPAVVSMSPTDGATNQATSSRIGISFSDLIDVATLDTSNLAVQPVINGTAGPVVSGIFSHQFGLVNFAPSSPLIPNTTYQITLLAGGVKDVSGNGTPTQFVSTFTTGADSGNNANPPVINSVTASTVQPFEVNQAVTLFVDASDPDMPLEILWNFGDGTILDWSSSQSSVAHTFSAAGNYSVLVRVRDASGASSATIYNVSVAEPAPQSQPQQASQLALDDGRRQLWAVNPDNDTVTLIHADNLNIIQEIAVCDQPTSVAIDGQDQVWITCQKADQLRVLSAADGSLISNLDMPYGSGPVSIVFTPDGSTGYMAEYASGRIVEINPSTRTVTSGFVIGNTPQALAISGDGNQLLISQFISPD